MNHGRETADKVVVSLFVNPLQFGIGEDFEKYPRDFERDRQLAEEAGVDILFTPRHEDLYPEDYQTYVSVEQVTQGLCGASRPGHFRGVTTVVCKLFQLVKPHKAIFGLKDYQQVVTIKQMVRDLNMDVEVIGRPTVREADGLAMSSRNVYLSAEDRMAALSLSQSLSVAQKKCREGERRGRFNPGRGNPDPDPPPGKSDRLCQNRSSPYLEGIGNNKSQGYFSPGGPGRQNPTDR